MEMARQCLKSIGIRAALVAVWLASASASQAAAPVCIDACAQACAKVAALVAFFESDKAFFTSRRLSENRIEEQQLDLFADRTSSATMQAKRCCPRRADLPTR